MDLVAYWKQNFVPYLRALFGRSERGAALVEYALLIALIAVVCIAAIGFLGKSAKSKFSDVGHSIAAAGS
jgi:pilus assembly protein Flp/PilA